MKFKKFIAAVSAAALSLSMASAINVNADEADTASSYSFAYDIRNDKAYVCGVVGAEKVSEVEIPEKTEAGVPVVGVDNFSFVDCEELKTVIVPDSFDALDIGAVAFLTEKDILAYLSNNSIDLNAIKSNADAEAKSLAYMANVAHYMDKTEWTGSEEELKDALTVFKNVTNNLKTSADEAPDMTELIKRLYSLDSASYPAYIRQDGENTLEKMSEKTYHYFNMWVNGIPYDDLTIKGTKGTGAEEYANGKAILGIKFAEKTAHLLGDANQDGTVNVRDAAWIARALATGKVDEMITCKICADYNEDGTVNVRDAAAIARYLASKKS